MALRKNTLSRLAGVVLISAFAAFAPPATAQQLTVPIADLMVEGPLGDVWIGNPEARVTIIEYASMTCPHCRNFHETVFDEFVAKYVDTGLVRFTIREFPIDPPNFPLSAAAFMLARCAPGENGYFGMIDLLFEMQPMWAQVQEPIPPLRQLALQMGIDQAAFDACLSNASVQEAVYAVYQRGIELGVNATPTFFVNGTQYAGALTLEQLDRVIEPLL